MHYDPAQVRKDVIRRESKERAIMDYRRFKMPSMKIFCVLLSTTILLLGCHDHQALDNFATNKKLKEAIATDLNNKAEELLAFQSR